MTTVSALGALVALIVSIVLILRKVPPAYGMIAGALAGGLVGGADLIQTINLMITGAQGITNAVLRILAAGILAGVLIESGAANTIAETIVRKVGEKTRPTGTGSCDDAADSGRGVYRCRGDYRFPNRSGHCAPCGYFQNGHLTGDGRRWQSG